VQARELLRSEEGRLEDLQTGKRPPEKRLLQPNWHRRRSNIRKAAEILKSDEAQYAAGGLPLTI
jgi:HlyD family secretion protein